MSHHVAFGAQDKEQINPGYNTWDDWSEKWTGHIEIDGVPVVYLSEGYVRYILLSEKIFYLKLDAIITMHS